MPANDPTAVPASDITFVVRSAGERTLVPCMQALRSQLGPAGHGAIHVISERPFTAAVRRTLEIGIECRRPFTVGIDADVLLMDDGVATIGRLAAGMEPMTYTVVGLMLCRFFGGYCFRGVHVYQSRHLERALRHVGARTPGGADPALKPETAIVNAMQAEGYGFESIPVRLGVHDFEQACRHIYLKMRLRARRELEIDGGPAGFAALQRYCQQRAAHGESDFTVALWGLEDGAADAAMAARGQPAPAEYDWFAAWPDFDRRMAELGWTEKPDLAPGAAAGLADRLMRMHRLDTDQRTPAWIRERLLGRSVA